MSYREFSPPPELAQHIRLIWQFEAPAHAGAEPEPQSLQRIVPDGHPELILHFGDPYSEVDADGNATRQAQALFAGQLTGPLLLQAGAHTGVLGVRFRPAAARAFFGVPMQELTDRRIALVDLWGESAAQGILGLATKSEPDERVVFVAAALRERLAATATPMDAGIARSVEILLAQDTRASLDDLAADCSLSRRQFERRFLTEVGVSPRLLAGIARFRKLFDALEQDTLRIRHWAEAAHAAGYFDQAHMNRDFKRFAGLPPQAFCQGLGGLSAAMVGAEVP